MVHAGDYPVVTDSGTVAEGETIIELMPVVLGTDGKIKAVTSDTVADVYGCHSSLPPVSFSSGTSGR